jgi:hypothetical protein
LEPAIDLHIAGVTPKGDSDFMVTQKNLYQNSYGRDGMDVGNCLKYAGINDLVNG